VASNLAFFRRMLYALKRQHGYEGAIYRPVQGVTDLETGAKTLTQTVYDIDRVVVIPYRANSLGFYGSALLKASREFSYGGFNDQDVKTVIIDGADLPDDFVIVQSDVFVYRHIRYEIKYIEMLEEDAGYNLTVSVVKGVQPNEVHNVEVFQTIRFVQSVGEVLN
jgi:hypothetical protein